MSDKLQELTERLYQEGLSKGKEEGEQILAAAKAEALGIVSKAKEEAAGIVAEAEKEAEDLKSKVTSDLKMASAQCLQATKKDIEDLITFKISKEEALSDPDFLKEIIKTVAEKFSVQESADLALILPESLKDKLEPWVKGQLATELASKPDVAFSKKMAGGFTIGPKDGGYFISLSDETFNGIISEYLRPVTRKILFGE